VNFFLGDKTTKEKEKEESPIYLLVAQSLSI